jgi:hypothetical protein
VSEAGVSVSESATAFSLTCAGEPASGIAITLPLRTVQASATAAAEQPCVAPICASVRSVIKRLFSPSSGEYAITGRSCCSGARAGEITQLRGIDIEQRGNLHVMRLRPQAGSIKTGEARTVPLHEHLIEQG